MLLLATVLAVARGPGCWTWEGGSSSIITKIAPQPVSPAGRCCAQTWTLSGTTYLFGGAGPAPGSSEAVYQADMWRWDSARTRWSLLHQAGSLSPNAGGGAAAGFPAARNYAITWQTDGKLWMWGGEGARYDGDTDGGFLNDTWSFDTATRRWTPHAITGEQPPVRNWGNGWSAGGGVYLNGGITAPPPPPHPPQYEWPVSDLWHFSTKTLAWTRLYTHRPNASCASYDGAAPHPGARSNSYTVVTDSGDLMLYGGEGCSGTQDNDGDFQDVWRYRVGQAGTPGRWDHIAGPEGVGGAPVYGKRGNPTKANLPPAEHAGYIVPEPYEGALWFLAGENGEETAGMRNDLWSFNLTTLEWAWEAGKDGYNGTATYGTLGTPAAANTPGARYAGQGWVADGRIWTFGGYGFDAKGVGGYLDDVWSFRLPCGQ